MRTFDSFKSYFKAPDRKIEETNENYKEELAREIYKDTEKYIFIDTLTMYSSGDDSNFKKGIVIIKAPQVRRLYYVYGLKPHKNKNAHRLWFEVVKQKNMSRYIKQYYTEFQRSLR